MPDHATFARIQEDAGYDGIFAAETAHDAFITLAAASVVTERVELGTGIAVAFARNPMTLAQQANDVHLMSGGRLIVGLGSQIKAHITRRYSMAWSHPAPRMREFILATRAIWDCWNNGTKLDFHGDFYSHTLMTPFFDPGPNPYGVPKVFVAAVGPLMTEVAGEVADGLLAHGFTTEAYLREHTVPALERGLATQGRSLDDFEISYPAFIVTGRTDEQVAAADAAVRQQIAFYGSTPAYKPVLDHHGWGELQPELNALSKQGKWVEMGTLIDDDVLDAFAVVAEPEQVGAKLLERFAGVVTRVSFYAPYAVDADVWPTVLEDLHAG